METVPYDDASALSPDAARARTHELLEHEWAVLVFTRGRKGSCLGRPMARARVDHDGTMSFVTRIDSSAIAEIEANSEVTFALQGKVEYAVVRGNATVTQDRSLIEALWDDSWRVWFPDGREDVAIAIVRVIPLEGRYWDVSQTRGVSFYYRLGHAEIARRELSLDDRDRPNARPR